MKQSPTWIIPDRPDYLDEVASLTTQELADFVIEDLPRFYPIREWIATRLLGGELFSMIQLEFYARLRGLRGPSSR